MKRRNFLVGLLLSPLGFLLGQKCDAKENSLPANEVYARFKWHSVWMNRKELAILNHSKAMWFESGTKTYDIEELKKIAIDEYIARTKDITGKNCTCLVNYGSVATIIFGKVDVSQYTYTKQMVKVAKLVASRY